MFEGLSGDEHRHNLLLAQRRGPSQVIGTPPDVTAGGRPACGGPALRSRPILAVQSNIGPNSYLASAIPPAMHQPQRYPRSGRWPARLARVPRVVSARTFLKTSKSEQCMLQTCCPRVFLWFLAPMIQTPPPQQVFRIERNKNHCTVSHINDARPLFESKCI